MKTGYKFLIGGGILAGIVGGVLFRLNRLRRTKAKLETIVTVKPNMKKKNFDLLVTIKNPTPGKFSLKHPFVTIRYKGALLGSSKSINKDYPIPAYGEKRLDAIQIAIPLVNALTTGAQLFTDLEQRKPVTLEVNSTTTAIETGSGIKIPVDLNEPIILKQA